MIVCVRGACTATRTHQLYKLRMRVAASSDKRGAKNHSFPDFREPRLELVMALFTPHQTTPNPIKNLFARASPGTKLRAMRRMVKLHEIGNAYEKSKD